MISLLKKKKNVLSVLKVTLYLQDDFLYLWLYSSSADFYHLTLKIHSYFQFLCSNAKCLPWTGCLISPKSIAYLRQITDGKTPSKPSHLQFSQWIKITYHNNIQYNDHLILSFCNKTLLLSRGFACNKRRLAFKN